MARLAFRKHISNLPSHLIPSRPREAEAKTSEEGIGDRKQVQSFTTYISRGEWCVPSSLSAEDNEGHMNATILLVDVASASRDSWKSFLQNHNYQVFTAGDKESAVRQCLQLQ